MDTTLWIEDTGEPRAQKCACVVRRGARAKGLQPQYLAYSLPDTLLGCAGPRQEAEEIKRKLGQFLREHLKLEMSDEKTLITQASTRNQRALLVTRSSTNKTIASTQTGDVVRMGGLDYKFQQKL